MMMMAQEIKSHFHVSPRWNLVNASFLFIIITFEPSRQTALTHYLLVAVPAAVRSVLERVEDNTVTVSWTDVPRGQRGGCITNYTIYLESDSGWRQACRKTKYLLDPWQMSLI